LPLQPHAPERVVVEVDYGSATTRGRPPDQAWLIRLRCGDKAVILSIGLRRSAAERLADHIIEVLGPHANDTSSGVCAQHYPTTLDHADTLELVTLLEFLVGWLDADLDYARTRLPLYGTYTVDDLRADTVRLLHAIKKTNIES
jgi:hypothetical protein